MPERMILPVSSPTITTGRIPLGCSGSKGLTRDLSVTCFRKVRCGRMRWVGMRWAGWGSLGVG